MNNEKAYAAIRKQMDQHGIAYSVIEHGPTRTSEDSARARAAGGAPDARGAKALVVRCELRKGGTCYATLVVPSQYRIDGQIVRGSIGLKKFRFLTPEEMVEIVQLSPGCMPPFGRTIFERVSALYVDPHLKEYPQVGFNAARLETSIVVASVDYLAVAQPTAILPLVTSAELVETDRK